MARCNRDFPRWSNYWGCRTPAGRTQGDPPRRHVRTMWTSPLRAGPAIMRPASRAGPPVARTQGAPAACPGAVRRNLVFIAAPRAGMVALGGGRRRPVVVQYRARPGSEEELCRLGSSPVASAARGGPHIGPTGRGYWGRQTVRGYYRTLRVPVPILRHQTRTLRLAFLDCRQCRGRCFLNDCRRDWPGTDSPDRNGSCRSAFRCLLTRFSIAGSEKSRSRRLCRQAQDCWR